MWCMREKACDPSHPPPAAVETCLLTQHMPANYYRPEVQGQGDMICMVFERFVGEVRQRTRVGVESCGYWSGPLRGGGHCRARTMSNSPFGWHLNRPGRLRQAEFVVSCIVSCMH